MLRSLNLALVIALIFLGLVPAGLAQGIRGVTRRTTTLERQLPARQFFDAAGVPVNGPTGANAIQPSGIARTPPALVARPPTVLPPISERIARPQQPQFAQTPMRTIPAGARTVPPALTRVPPPTPTLVPTAPGRPASLPTRYAIPTPTLPPRTVPTQPVPAKPHAKP
ncbi:MAG: hypothetical protein AB7O66_03655 [Limisphaerales bacterium]